MHFTVNTFTDREWGDGEESPEIFFPEKFDAEQWVRAIVSAGMQGRRNKVWNLLIAMGSVLSGDQRASARCLHQCLRAGRQVVRK